MEFVPLSETNSTLDLAFDPGVLVGLVGDTPGSGDDLTGWQDHALAVAIDLVEAPPGRRAGVRVTAPL